MKVSTAGGASGGSNGWRRRGEGKGRAAEMNEEDGYKGFIIIRVNLGF